MAEKATIIHSVNIRLDGTLTIVDRDSDESILKRVDIANPDDLDPEQIAAWYLLGKITVPDECSRVTVRRADGDEMEVITLGDVISLVDRLNG